jgi:rubrerythrin
MPADRCLGVCDTVPSSLEEHGTTRAQLLRRSTTCGGALVGGGVVWGLSQLTFAAPSAEQDARVFNLVLALEQLKAAFYDQALARAGLKGELREFARTVAEHEKSHVAFLKQALGGAAGPAPQPDFGDRLADADAFTAAAVSLEDLAVATYNGQAVNLTTASLKAAARVVSVEARHAAWIRSIVGEVPATQPTDAPATEAETRARLRDFGVDVG